MLFYCCHMCEYNFLSISVERRLFQEFQPLKVNKAGKTITTLLNYINILLILNICLHYTIVLPIVLIHCILLPLQSRRRFSIIFCCSFWRHSSSLRCLRFCCREREPTESTDFGGIPVTQMFEVLGIEEIREPTESTDCNGR